MDYRHLTAPCGLDCFNCSMYLARNDKGLRSKIAQNLGISESDAWCKGCRDHGGRIPALGMTRPCSVYRCITQKGLDFCYECDEFPCDHLHPYADKASVLPHNTKIFNLCLIKKMGLEKWAKEKAGEVKRIYFKGKFTL